MTTQDDGIAIILANRHYLYQLLQHIFGIEPNQELLDIATNQHTQEALELMLDEEHCDLNTYLALLTELRQALFTDPIPTLDKLTSEYTSLMIGPHKLPAPPWESVYVTKERALFQESTLKVRRTYLNYQFLPANYPHEADDHLAFELDFMAHLAKLTLERFDEQTIDQVKKLLDDQKTFLQNHLLVWVGDFAEDIQKSKTHHFYPQMAALTKLFLETDNLVLDELLSLV
ncbi:MAG TPA: molecular chaperone TorD family protein [Desulfitobacterium dehalogenans]|uniref:Molecular chaperone TorD family protein n=1 Tax=Desulfitobacterium dehalogenans TaxID=36854 RepID=A0A7C7DB81_9FIRM|nr:molecular chaperone TorD family protein [Desulfitobacterium dehalogenans]